MENKAKSILLGLFAVGLWSAIPAFVKTGSDAESLPFLLTLRFLLASVFFITLVPKLIRLVPRVQTKYWIILLVSLGANFYFQGLAMIHLPVSWYLVIFCLNPALALFFIGVKFNRKLVIGLLMSMIGTFLFLDWKEVTGSYGPLPFLFLTIGMLTWVAYTVLVKKFQTVYSSLEVTGITQILSLMACTFIWLADGAFFKIPTQAEGVSILALGILTPLAYFGFTACLRTLPRFSIVAQYLEPIFGFAIGVMFFNESLTVAQIAGSMMIVFGSVAIEK